MMFFQRGKYFWQKEKNRAKQLKHRRWKLQEKLK